MHVLIIIIIKITTTPFVSHNHGLSYVSAIEKLNVEKLQSQVSQLQNNSV